MGNAPIMFADHSGVQSLSLFARISCANRNSNKRMNNKTAITLAHFGIGASYVVASGAAALNIIPGWGVFAAAIVGAAAHVVTARITSTVRKNVDPRFE
jgi:hypothetical protein